MDVLLTSFRIRNEETRFQVVTFAFFEDLVRAVLVFILNIEDRIDEVFALQKTYAILPAEAREHGALVESSLAVQVDLRGPPGRCAVFELRPEGVEVVAASLGAIRREVLDLEVAGFLEIVIIGDEVRSLLGKGRRRRENPG